MKKSQLCYNNSIVHDILSANMNSFFQKFTAYLKNYADASKDTLYEYALSRIELFYRGIASAKSTFFFYSVIGGRKEINREEKEEIKKIEEEKGFPLSEEEKLQFVIKRGMQELERNGAISRMNASFLEREILRDVNQNKENRDKSR